LSERSESSVFIPNNPNPNPIIIIIKEEEVEPPIIENDEYLI
jgi:hypothetical protein